VKFGLRLSDSTERVVAEPHGSLSDIDLYFGQAMLSAGAKHSVASLRMTATHVHRSEVIAMELLQKPSSTLI